MPKKKFIRNSVAVASTSALALILSTAPVVIDLTDSGMGLKLNHAYADSSCFVAGTRVRMADGTLVPIEKITVGDRVLGANGEVNIVLGIERRRLGKRRLYGFNGANPFVTAEHPFFTHDGTWKSLNPAMTAVENPTLKLSPLQVGDSVQVWSRQSCSQPGNDGNLALAVDPAPQLESILLQTIESVEAPEDTPVFNLLLNGNNTYFADDYLVHNKGGDGGGGGGGEGGGGEGGEGGGGEGGGGEGGEGGEAGESGEAGEAGEAENEVEHEVEHEGEQGERGRGRGRGRGMGGGTSSASSGPLGFGGDVSPEGPALSADQEADAISKGWGN